METSTDNYDPDVPLADVLGRLQGRRPWLCTVIWQRQWPTSDDWHPNFPRDTVRITVYAYATGVLRAVVADADDTSMECDTPGVPEGLHARAAAYVRWLERALPNPLTRDWLMSQGFIRV